VLSRECNMGACVLLCQPGPLQFDRLTKTCKQLNFGMHFF